MKSFICCVLLVLMGDPSVSEDAPRCCVDVLANGSATYTLNTTGCGDTIWNLNGICIKDQYGDIDRKTVITYGPNWIHLYEHYSGVNYMCMDDSKKQTPVQCTDCCEKADPRSGDNRSHEDDGDHGGPVLSTEWITAIISAAIIIIIIILIILIIGWKTGWYRRCRGDAANRREANNANHANGEFQAVDQEESGV